MKIGRRALALALSLALLCSCAPMEPGTQESEPMRVVRVLTLLVPNTLDQVVLEQADAFAADAARLSGGQLVIDVRTGQSPADALTGGEADLAFLRNAQMAQLDERFSTFALPFLYDDHQHLSLALNSEELLGRLNTGLQPRGIRLLNAFYSGSAFLVSTKGELRTPSDYKGIAAALRTDNADKLAVFSSLGARVLPYSASAIPNMLGAQAELLPEGADGPAEEVTVDTIEVDTEQALALEADPNTLFFIKSYHAAAPLWLGANEQSLTSLTAYERAVLSEACAGLLAGLERVYTDREAAAFDELRARGVEVVEIERQQVSAVLYDSSRNLPLDPGRYLPPAYFDRRLYEIIQSYSPLS
ncbi:hypothetical protein [Anaerotruncus massiliensis (ex Togo et al. 2019)]|uniref:hypothetical protein n=1 Tax=Anaerotruncus TaxID=244127 RepID=UPI000C77BDB4|nr:hypothetical protein [Anaerotruncus massiliensis (ex Togo et al. 2019)]